MMGKSTIPWNSSIVTDSGTNVTMIQSFTYWPAYDSPSLWCDEERRRSQTLHVWLQIPKPCSWKNLSNRQLFPFLPGNQLEPFAPTHLFLRNGFMMMIRSIWVGRLWPTRLLYFLITAFFFMRVEHDTNQTNFSSRRIRLKPSVLMTMVLLDFRIYEDDVLWGTSFFSFLIFDLLSDGICLVERQLQIAISNSALEQCFYGWRSEHYSFQMWFDWKDENPTFIALLRHPTVRLIETRMQSRRIITRRPFPPTHCRRHLRTPHLAPHTAPIV